MADAPAQLNRKIAHRTGFLVNRPALRRYLEEGLSCPPDGDFLTYSVPTGEDIDIKAMLAQMSSSLVESEQRGYRFTDAALAHYDCTRRKAASELRTRLVRVSASERHWEYGPSGAELAPYEQKDVSVPVGSRLAGAEDAQLPTLLWDVERTAYENRRLQIFVRTTTELIQHTTKRGRFETEDLTFIAILPTNVYERRVIDVQELTDVLYSPDRHVARMALEGLRLEEGRKKLEDVYRRSPGAHEEHGRSRTCTVGIWLGVAWLRAREGRSLLQG